MAPKKSGSKQATSSKAAAKKAATTKDPAKAETVTEAEAGPQGTGGGQTDEVRAGLATGSNAGREDQPDGVVLDTTIVPSSPDEDTKPELSVVVGADGKKGPAA